VGDVPESLGPSGQQVVAAAAREARGLWHAEVEPEHLLLALTRLQPPYATAALGEFGVTYEEVRELVLDLVGPGADDPPASPPLGSAGAAALKQAARAAIEAGTPQVGPGTLLLGVLRVDEGIVPQLLTRLAVHREALRRRVRDLLPAEPATLVESIPAPLPSPVAPVAGGDVVTVRCPTCREPLDGALGLRAVDAERADGGHTSVDVVHCRRCGTALATLP
jgi:Clp amino terminal domain, pathogenicity island component